ncbi:MULTISPECIES: ABC transporter substrate-binding protein [Methylobacterium]|jgi:branched-chain amino acid transport system substrate-binding protein|uniref:ABC transporter substrate-binding protein n=1 Tax=Methylobacterium TaxID=407 RepID=UPI0008E5DE88|nr:MULTISPECIES: ABC transporter substrate-binding protein [Methylobacterium]MBZ6411630.1 ABC transporter substrate-binding protein [Methylobacterium sp.]MBK3400241.1 ABC transporter substrate-binding protein [Methylobacterium ajmalii]MBK3411903.1 ABC transporter substrate-binding protein [Methylobacterium ajmalii]MBK3425217.1 ABC transporter substrate-binding protein [Methylobacterium ajmalii]SFE41508.1 branched-chain amino acid transport system substrate-binding protein [Methylobacterium sp.
MPRRPIRRLAPALAALLSLLAPAAAAERPVKIGVLNDMSGPYADYQGQGSVIAAQLAIEDFSKQAGRPVELVSADHQNKTDIGASIARRWFDQDGVDLIVDVPNSAVALAVANLAREKNKVFIGSGAGTAELTGKQCSPNTVHWTYDTWSLGHALAKALVQQGGKSWYFLTADYTFGKDLEGSAAEEVKAMGGSVKGGSRHPLGTSDFSSFLLQAQASGADVIGLANAGDDTSNALKQAAEFGIAPGQRLAGLILNITNMPALGLKATQGVYIVTPYYWNLDDGTRAFAARYAARHPRHAMPNDMQAGVYSAVEHYLKSLGTVKDAGDGRSVVAAMKAMPTDDPIFGKGRIREDGRKLHPMYLLETKTPAESKGSWDYFKPVRTVPAEEAWRPLAEGGCPLVKG